MTDFKIGMWGTSRAGKTTYLAMLYQEFLTDNTRWKTHTNDEARQFLEEARTQIYKDHVFPEKTVATQHYLYHVTYHEHESSFVLDFLDTAGELYEKYYDREKRDQTVKVTQRDTAARTTDLKPNEIFDYLKTCNGILFFVDPSWTGETSQDLMIAQILEDLAEHRREMGGQPPKVALVVSKADANTAYWTRREMDWQCDHAEECADRCPVYRELKAPFMNNWIKAHPTGDAVKCFVVSSIGRVKDQSNVSEGHAWRRAATPSSDAIRLSRRSTKWDYLKGVLKERRTTETYHPRSINQPELIVPVNLRAPIEWMLDIVDIAPEDPPIQGSSISESEI